MAVSMIEGIQRVIVFRLEQTGDNICNNTIFILLIKKTRAIIVLFQNPQESGVSGVQLFSNLVLSHNLWSKITLLLIRVLRTLYALL